MTSTQILLTVHIGFSVMADLFVKWQKNVFNSSWFRLIEIDPLNIAVSGVYLIWYSGVNPRVVYIGQGDISGRLSSHQNESRILKYASEGTLLTTWGSVDDSLKRGVERFLIDTYKPLVNVRVPNVRPISVNLLVR